MAKSGSKKKRKKKAPPKRQPVLDPAQVPEPATPEAAKEAAKHKPSGQKEVSGFQPPADDPENNQYLRFAAGLYYTTNLNQVTIEQMSEHPIYGAVAKSTLYHWSKLDGWTDRRAENLNRWRAAIESKMGDKLVRARVDALDRLRGLFDKVLSKLEADVVDAKSYEGLLSSFVKLSELMDGWNEKLLGDMVPQGPAAIRVGDGSTPATLPGGTPKPQLSEEEAREAAMLILKKRRADFRAKNAKEEAEESGKSRPQLRVVDASLDK